MSDEFEIPPSLIKKIPPHDKEVILLGVMFFYIKRLGVKDVSTAILKHPGRDIIFPNLNEFQIDTICSKLNLQFEEGECAANAELRSNYSRDESPEEFAVSMAGIMLWENARGYKIPWFHITDYGGRQLLIKAVMGEKLRDGLKGLLASGEEEMTS